MKKFIKILLCVVLVIAVVAAVVVGPYAISFLPFKTDENFDVPIGNIVVNVTDSIKDIHKNGNVSLNGVLRVTPTEAKSEIFNYYGISYTSDSYLKGTLTYEKGLKEVSEDFFLEPSKKEATFYSFIDGCLDGEKGQKVISLTFECLNKESCKVNIRGFSVFNRKIPEQEIFIENETHKLGIDLLWGGALSYLEDLDSDVQAVSVDGKIKVDSNASQRYNAESVNNNVNLINRNDTGRLVQQSYYGTLDYDFGVYMDNDWRYNPVQGGNQFNDASKIVDLRVTDTEIYIKCRPLDWAKEKECITPSYMEATYSLDGGFKTEFGYVYLTDSPLVAIDFGNRRFVNRSLSSQNIELAVICVELDECCLEIDIAETETPTSTVLGAKYFRIGRDVNKEKFVKYAIFNFVNYNDCCQYYDNPDNMINIKWNEI